MKSWFGVWMVCVKILLDALVIDCETQCIGAILSSSNDFVHISFVKILNIHESFCLFSLLSGVSALLPSLGVRLWTMNVFRVLFIILYHLRLLCWLSACLKILPPEEIQHLEFPIDVEPNSPVKRVVYKSDGNKSFASISVLSQQYTEATRFNLFTGNQTLHERKESFKVIILIHVSWDLSSKCMLNVAAALLFLDVLMQWPLPRSWTLMHF